MAVKRSSVCLGGAFLVVAVLGACGESASSDSCSDPAPECRTLCDVYCAALTTCGQAPADCATVCIGAYRCPGESRGQDQAICDNERTRLEGATCTATCTSTARWSGCSLEAGADAAAGG